jgi:hypothetical protein
MRERKESGLSIRAYCESAGYHENIYYYWQRKVREAVCGEMRREPSKAARSLKSAGFVEAKLAERDALPTPAVEWQSQICVDAAGVRITAGGEYPVCKLAALLRELVRPC